MKPLINWEELQSLNKMQNPPQSIQNPDQFWGKQAPMYNQMAHMEKKYTANQINAIGADVDDTVLDIGCGPGRITSMIAPRVSHVTAIDASEKMLEYCQTNCKNLGLTNVTTLLLKWEDAILSENIEKHDIAIASRSVGMQDIRKLNRFAKKKAVVICWANAPHIPLILDEMFKNTNDTFQSPSNGFKSDRRLGYNVVFNMVYDLGLDPNISIVEDGFSKNYPSYEEAYDDLRKLRNFDDEKLPVFKENLKPLLTENEDGSVTFCRETRSFVLWWTPKSLD